MCPNEALGVVFLRKFEEKLKKGTFYFVTGDTIKYFSSRFLEQENNINKYA